jgi:hypothetical protein
MGDKPTRTVRPSAITRFVGWKAAAREHFAVFPLSSNDQNWDNVVLCCGGQVTTQPIVDQREKVEEEIQNYILEAAKALLSLVLNLCIGFQSTCNHIRLVTVFVSPFCHRIYIPFPSAVPFQSASSHCCCTVWSCTLSGGGHCLKKDRESSRAGEQEAKSIEARIRFARSIHHI